MYYHPALLALNPAVFSNQAPIIAKSSGTSLKQHLPAFQQPLEVLEPMLRPVKRQKVSAKAKTADENCLSAAAIVDPVSLSTNKSTTDSGLAA
jgi:hypothetical protein